MVPGTGQADWRTAMKYLMLPVYLVVALVLLPLAVAEGEREGIVQ